MISKEWHNSSASRPLVEELTTDIPADAKNSALENKKAAVCWMGQLIDWHWRDAKPAVAHFIASLEKTTEQHSRKTAPLGNWFRKEIEKPKGGKIIHRSASQNRRLTFARQGEWHRQERIGI